ncbi:hypothetical protein BJY04DRAFT_219001 [Aspergillus karnatakaensis]|uniref:GNAT family N-acetyltransferase n=1 Tax=Aspergillus karnatakaensis TaxID=1810916 RepID=UPI003CCD2C07
MEPHHNIQIIPVSATLTPQSPYFSRILQKYKLLRLRSLTTDPSSFTSTLERETAFSDKTWTSRLLNPLGRVFVALQAPPRDYAIGSDGDGPDIENEGAALALSEGDWLGMLTMHGPVAFPQNTGASAAAPATSEENGPEKESGAEQAPWTLFKDLDFESAARAKGAITVGSRVACILLGMYVIPEARGRGIGRGLIEAAVGAVEKESRERGWSAHVSVLVLGGNEGAKGLYESMGFVSSNWQGKEEGMVEIEGDQAWALALDIGSS